MFADPAEKSKRDDTAFHLRPYVHVLQNDSVTALFDAVSFELAYISRKWRPLVAAIECRDYAALKAYLADRESTRFLAELVRNGFVTSIEQEEDRLLAFRRSLCPGPIRVMDIIPTFLCNLACRYCYQCEELQSGNPWRGVFLEVEEAEAIVDGFLAVQEPHDMAGTRPIELCIIGGEPLLHTDLLHSVIPRARRHPLGSSGRLNITLVTNATLVTPELAAFLAKFDVFVIVSIDGSRAVHDGLRVFRSGHGTFEQARQGYCLLRNAGCRLGVSQIVGTHNNCSYVEDTRYILETFQPDDLCSNSCLHGLPGQPNVHRIPAADFARQMEALYMEATLGADSDGARHRGNVPSSMCQHLSRDEAGSDPSLSIAPRRKGLPEQLVRRFRPFLSRTPMLHYCGAQNDKIVIAPDGRAHCCEGFAFLGVGMSDWRGRLSQHEGAAEDRLSWAQHSPVNVRECHGCPLLLQCGGGCRFDAFAASGSLAVMDAYRCEQDRELFHWFIVNYIPQVCDVVDYISDQIVVFDEHRRNQVRRTLCWSESPVAWR